VRRHSIAPRANFQKIVEDQGLIWHTGSKPYWHESAYYSFTSEQVHQLETATEAVHQMFVAAGEWLIANPDILVEKFGIPERFIQPLIDSWNSDGPCLNYGRFDFGYDGINPPKLFEYNCDTPTSMLETGVIQWWWKVDRFPNNDQFNSLHDKMVDAYEHLRIPQMTFTGVDDGSGEDAVTLGYHMDLAEEAGISCQSIHITDIGFDSIGRNFVDLENFHIDAVYKLYPWEWMVQEEFGYHAATGNTLWLEPIWKMMWSNKAILPILCQLFPEHPYLLNSSFTPLDGDHVVKPILAREGANIMIHKDGQVIAESGGEYDGPVVYQELYDLPNFAGLYPVIGSWCVNGYAAGVGIREAGLITDNTAQFTPHIIQD